MLRLLLADDHEIVRRGERSLIAENPAWEITGEAANGREALELALRDPPDVAVVDVAMPDLDGIALTRQLKELLPEVRVLLFTIHDDQETVRRGLEAGARGYLVKSDGEHEPEGAISALGANHTYFSASVSEMLLAVRGGRVLKTMHDMFTARELDVIRLIARGKTNGAIARQLGVSVKTVESHRSAALRKADVRTAADLVRFGIKQGIIAA